MLQTNADPIHVPINYERHIPIISPHEMVGWKAYVCCLNPMSLWVFDYNTIYVNIWPFS